MYMCIIAVMAISVEMKTYEKFGIQHVHAQ